MNRSIAQQFQGHLISSGQANNCIYSSFLNKSKEDLISLMAGIGSLAIEHKIEHDRLTSSNTVTDEPFEICEYIQQWNKSQEESISQILKQDEMQCSQRVLRIFQEKFNVKTVPQTKQFKSSECLEQRSKQQGNANQNQSQILTNKSKSVNEKNSRKLPDFEKDSNWSTEKYRQREREREKLRIKQRSRSRQREKQREKQRSQSKDRFRERSRSKGTGKYYQRYDSRSRQRERDRNEYYRGRQYSREKQRRHRHDKDMRYGREKQRQRYGYQSYLKQKPSRNYQTHKDREKERVDRHHEHWSGSSQHKDPRYSGNYANRYYEKGYTQQGGYYHKNESQQAHTRPYYDNKQSLYQYYQQAGNNTQTYYRKYN